MSLSRNPEDTRGDELRADLWLEQAALALYQTDRAAHADWPIWDRAHPDLCADFRYRALGAHQRGNPTVKAVLIEELARTLATLDGYIWPACENKHRASEFRPAEYRAIIATIRQRFRHNARAVITATFAYLDIHAVAEPEDMRVAVIARAKAQQIEDVHAVQEWKRIAPVGVPASGHDGDVFGDSRR